MKFQAEHVLALLKALAEKHGIQLTHKGFADLEVALRQSGLNISQRYLYESMYRPIRRSEDEISLSEGYIDELAQHLGFKSFYDFREQTQNKILLHPSVKNCIGNWYSYARRTNGEPIVLRAPIQIYQDGEFGVMMMDMKGGGRYFSGKITYLEQMSILNCTLASSTQDKLLHVTLRVTLDKSSPYLKGVYSGVSSLGNPVAGKELLIRQDLAYEDMVPAQMPIANALTSEDMHWKAAGKFFEKEESVRELGSNIIRIEHS